MANLVRRKAERKCFCRSCDKEVERGEEVVYTHSWRNRGQHIYFCIPCAIKIGELVMEDE